MTGHRNAAAGDVELERALESVKGRLFIPHAGGQIEVLDNEARFQAIAAGRRWGKTKLAARKIIREALGKPGSMNWWIANTYKNVRRGYRNVVRQIPPALLAKPAPASTSNELILEFKNGAIIEFYSGGNPDALAGEGVDFAVVDEAALIPDAVWQQLIRPTLMDTKGGALIISTPRGKNWFWNMYQRGQGPDKAYASWRFPQSSNPYIDPEETAAAREELPELLFRQEIMAEFLAAGASIFGLGLERDGAIVDGLYTPRGQVYMGIDLAKHEDFTVISAVRGEDRKPVYHDRFNTISWPEQRRLIREAVADLEALRNVESVTVLMDSTGVGDVNYDDLSDEGLDVVPIKFSNDWKEKAVKLLAADLEQGKAFILPEQQTEFESYEYTMTDAGRYKFEAATGHDDEVSAKLLEHWGIYHEGPPDIHTLEVEEAEVIDEVPTGDATIEPDSTADLLMRDEVWS